MSESQPYHPNEEKNPPKPNYYEILGVLPTATFEEIQHAYRKAALQHHPDMNPGDSSTAANQMVALNQAWQVLGKPQSRNEYDKQLQAQQALQATKANHQPTPYNSQPNWPSQPNWGSVGNPLADPHYQQTHKQIGEDLKDIHADAAKKLNEIWNLW